VRFVNHSRDERAVGTGGVAATIGLNVNTRLKRIVAGKTPNNL
jgi:hypothetical protein